MKAEEKLTEAHFLNSAHFLSGEQNGIPLRQVLEGYTIKEKLLTY